MRNNEFNKLSNKIRKQENNDDTFLYFIIGVFSTVILYAMFFSGQTQDVFASEKDIRIAGGAVVKSQNNYISSYLPELSQPEQINFRGDKVIKFKKGDLALNIYPRAEYKIYAMVMSKKKYNWGWESSIAPYDLALAWDKLMLPEYQKGINYSQGSRWYYFRYNRDFIGTESLIYRNSSNHHIIPANDNLLKAIKKVRVKDKIYMEGYLVYINGTSGNGTVWWNSSLSRNDRGDGACEILYLTKAIVGDKIYQ